MDAPRGLNEQEADKALRLLFREVGQIHAPEGLEERVLRRSSVMARHVPAPIRPLLPTWAWWLSGVLLLALAWSTGNDGTATGTMVRDLDLDLYRVLDSPWSIMGLMTFTVLFALERWLNDQRIAPAGN